MHIKTKVRDVVPIFRLLAGIATEKSLWDRHIIRTILNATDEHISLITFSSDKVVSIRIEGEVIKPGTGCLNIKRAAAYLKAVGGETDLEIIETESGLSFCQPDGSIRFFSAEYQNALDSIEVWRRELRQKGKPCFRIPESTFKQVLSFSNIIPPANNPRYQLDAVQLSFKKNLLVVSNTDSNRATRAFGKAETEGDGAVLISNEFTRNLIAALHSTSDALVEVYASQNLLEVRTDRFSFICQTRSGLFPELGKLFRDTSQDSVQVPREGLWRAMKIVQNDEDIETVYLRVSPTGITIEYGQKEKGRKKGLFELENGLSVFDGPTEVNRTIQVALNKKYLFEIANGVQAESFIFGIENEESPVVIAAQSLGFVHLIAPIRVSDDRVALKKAA